MGPRKTPRKVVEGSQTQYDKPKLSFRDESHIFFEIQKLANTLLLV
jgi:hypothetical protein